jgi:ribonuclease III
MIHPKAALIERLQKEGRGQPQFATQREGPDHEPTFRSQVRIQGKPYGEGEGGNKREAERRAAEATLAQLDRELAATAKPAGSGRRGRKGGGAAATAAAAEAAAATLDAAGALEAAPPAEDAPEPFAGPWPVFERVLAESLRIAHERVDGDLRGDVALVGIESFASRLYKDLLEGLGEVVDDD